MLVKKTLNRGLFSVAAHLSSSAKTFVLAVALVAASQAAHADEASCKLAWDSAQARSQKAETMSVENNFTDAEGHVVAAIDLWGKAALECSDTNADKAKANQKTSQEGLVILRKNIVVKRCAAIERAATARSNEANKAFEAKNWEQAASIFEDAGNQFAKSQAECEVVAPGVFKRNADMMAANKTSALKNSGNAAGSNVQCKTLADDVNRQSALFDDGIRTSTADKLMNVASDLEKAVAKLKQDCQLKPDLQTALDKQMKEFATSKQQVQMCNDGVIATQSGREKLIAYINQAPSGSQFSDTAKKFQTDRKRAQTQCFGQSLDWLRSMADTDTDLINEEKACLPALRKLAQSPSAMALSAVPCKTAVFTEQAEKLIGKK
jgi:tetratricopeptide (TPR) repeat protein